MIGVRKVVAYQNAATSGQVTANKKTDVFKMKVGIRVRETTVKCVRAMHGPQLCCCMGQ